MAAEVSERVVDGRGGRKRAGVDDALYVGAIVDLERDAVGGKRAVVDADDASPVGERPRRGTGGGPNGSQNEYVVRVARRIVHDMIVTGVVRAPAGGAIAAVDAVASAIAAAVRGWRARVT